MTVTMTSSGAVLIKAGANVNSALTDTEITRFINEAEGIINSVCRYNYVDNYPSNADVQGIFNQVSSDLAAISCINYDIDSYPSRTEAEDMINVLRDSALRGLAILRDKKVQDFINGA